MVDARRIVRQHYGRDYHPAYRTLAKVLATIAWPPAVLIHLWQIRRVHGPGAAPIKRVPGALWTAMRHNVLPSEYFAYALWRPDHRANIDNYLYSNETARLFRLLNRPSQVDPIDDKLAFHDLCKAHVLPTPAVLAAFAPTGKLLEYESGRPPARDLFIKPSLGVGGEGTERFRWQGVAFENDFGHLLTPEALDDYFAVRARSENRTLLVQPLLSNHPDLCLESTAPLATARLVTGRSTDGDVIAIFSFLYFSLFDRKSDQHWHVEGLIDLASGRLLMSPPQQDGSGTRLIHRNRELGSDECRLPEWDAALRHAKLAHAACPNFAFIGWDVAFTDQGPMLLEGNVNWSPSTYQSLRGEPLGHTKFAAILETQLRDRRRESQESLNSAGKWVCRP
jgi:Sugar-transfer associated ATP-grasp